MERDRGYRDELGAAQARIAELEAEVRSLRAPVSGDEPSLAPLEEKVAMARQAADPKTVRNGALFVAAILLGLFGVIGGIFFSLTPFLGIGTWLFGLLASYASSRAIVTDVGARTRRDLDAAERELSQAKRLHAVERALTDKVRVQTADEADGLEDPAKALPGRLSR